MFLSYHSMISEPFNGQLAIQWQVGRGWVSLNHALLAL